jgi:hypothetical protein
MAAPRMAVGARTDSEPWRGKQFAQLKAGVSGWWTDSERPDRGRWRIPPPRLTEPKVERKL